MLRFDSRISPIGQEKVIKGFVILLVVLAFGTTGYMIIEKWHFLDALYMTVITITTVGFREVYQVSETGRIFTIVIIFLGMGIMAYLVGMVAQAMVDFQVRSIIGRRKLGLKMRNLNNHYIICGFGRIGKIVCRELKANRIPMVVIDNAPETRRSLRMRRSHTSMTMPPLKMC